MELKSKEARNKIRRWTFSVTTTTSTGESVASIPIPGFTIGMRNAAKQASLDIRKTYEREEAKREPVESKRFRFNVELVPHERVNPELFAKFLELQKKSDDLKKQSETYRALIMIACQELSDRHPIELGKAPSIFAMLLKKFHALSDGKDPNAKIELVTKEQASHLGIR